MELDCAVRGYALVGSGLVKGNQSKAASVADLVGKELVDWHGGRR